VSHNECCSGYCYKEPGWELGVCKRIQIHEKSKNKNNNVQNNVQNNGVNDGIDDVCKYP